MSTRDAPPTAATGRGSYVRLIFEAARSMHQRGLGLAGAVTYAIERLRRRLPRRCAQYVPQRLRGPMQGVAVFVIEPVVEQDTLDLQQLGKYGGALHSGVISSSVQRRAVRHVVRNPPMLTLRLIGPNDYSVFDDGQRIGRIRFASERNGGLWVWHVQVHIPGPPFGTAASLDDANAQFKAAWLTFKEKHGPEKLGKAYAEMNKRDGP